MDSQPPLIEARGLTRRFGPNIAVDNLDLRLAPGEILGLLGPNGAGKSTTMKMLTGNLAPSQGEVLIKGQSLHEAAVLAKQQLGYLPERPPVYPELTVDEYLRYCAGLHGIPGSRRAEAVTSSKRDCGLTEVGRRLIGNLSKGFQQRVGLALELVFDAGLELTAELALQVHATRYQGGDDQHRDGRRQAAWREPQGG